MLRSSNLVVFDALGKCIELWPGEGQTEMRDWNLITGFSH